MKVKAAAELMRAMVIRRIVLDLPHGFFYGSESLWVAFHRVERSADIVTG
ncbi:hypothetical protein [Luteipulveratus halotolerans]|nr:hypothetical protein [Luteipulveratus halotolerans]